MSAAWERQVLQFTRDTLSFKYIFKSLLAVLLFIFSVDLLQRHRIYSISDVKAIVRSTVLPVVPENPRCKTETESSKLRCLPNVFVIGSSKSGTTSFIDNLSRRKEIFFARRGIHSYDKHSEIHRFDRVSFRSNWKYLELLHEWSSSPLVNSSDDLVVHYTPHYMYAPTVPFDMQSFYPVDPSQLKFIILLRNPVDRLISSYWFKNSKLFQKIDRGSVDDLMRQTWKGMQKR
jgi:hypothetical protein